MPPDKQLEPNYSKLTVLSVPPDKQPKPSRSKLRVSLLNKRLQYKFTVHKTATIFADKNEVLDWWP